ncbi:MAG: hypothetical protein AAFU41_04530 [Pseudomonadota bacterium]
MTKAKRQALTLAMGVPDDRQGQPVVDAQGAPLLNLRNQLRLPDATLAGIKHKEQLLWFPRPDDAPRITAGPTINICADFTTFEGALRAMARAMPQGAPVFNHPAAVMHLASMQLRDALAALDGLVVRKQIRIRPTEPDHFATAMEKGGLDYPLRVQRADDQTNQNVFVIRGVDDWAHVTETDWQTQTYLISQLSGQDIAQHPRIRLAFVGQHVELATFAYTHPPTPLAANLPMQVTIDPRRLRQISGAVARQVQLDFWTAEFSVRSSKTLALEYLWPGLPKSSKGDVSQLLWGKIAPRLEALVAEPGAWRSVRSQKSGTLH